MSEHIHGLERYRRLTENRLPLYRLPGFIFMVGAIYGAVSVALIVYAHSRGWL